MNRVTQNRYLVIGLAAVVVILGVFFWMRRGGSSKKSNEGKSNSTIEALYEKHNDDAMGKALAKLTSAEAEGAERILLHVAFEYEKSHREAIEAIRTNELTVNASKVLSIYTNSKASFKSESLIAISLYKWDDGYLPTMSKIATKEKDLTKRVASALAHSGSYAAEKKLISMQKKADPELFYYTAEAARSAKNVRLATRLLKMCKTYKSDDADYQTCVDHIKSTLTE